MALARVIGVGENSVNMHYYGTTQKNVRNAKFKPVYVCKDGQVRLGKPHAKEEAEAFTGQIQFEDFMELCPAFGLQLREEKGQGKERGRMTGESLRSFRVTKMRMHHY